MQKKPEILAPAGSLEALRAAVAAGCDAVYIGGNRFGARAFADNPSQEEMVEAIAYCHLHDVKIYMTVNTLLKDREVQQSLFAFLQPYYEAGLDAVIVQDLGVMRFVSRHFPSLAIHASTQMTLTMGAGADELSRFHVTRMVPARELTIEELCQLRRDTKLELEVFVHGALCCCYSGQCLFSSMLGGRSGNRGRCAQPCRMKYQCRDTKQGKGSEGSYLLSPKELCNLLYIPELIEAGVDSFKIEGRMKRPEYTAFVTAMYRKYVDLYFSLGQKRYQSYLTEHDKEWQEDLRCLAELYNRNGFTQGYLEGLAGDVAKRHPQKRGEMLAQKRPNHGGVCVGEILSVGKHEAVYRADKHLSAQDVVEFRDARQQSLYEYTLGSDVAAGECVTARYQKGSCIRKGDKVYRTKDAFLLAHIRAQYLEPKQQLAVCGILKAEQGKELHLIVQRKSSRRAQRGLPQREKEAEQDVICVEAFGTPCQTAENHPATEEAVRKTLNQTGNSLFYFEELAVELADHLFIPVGMLKNLRREAFAQLEKELTERFWRQDTVLDGEEAFTAEQEKPSAGCKMLTADYKSCADGQEETAWSASVMTEEQLLPVLQCEKIQTVYLQTEQMSAKELKKAYERVTAAKKRPWLVMPFIFRHAVWKLFEREWEKEDGIFSLAWDGFLVRNRESISFLTGTAGISRQKLRLDYNMYLMNRQTYLYWIEQGISKFTAPLELTKGELSVFPFLPQMELLFYGKLPLMVSAQCLCANMGGCVADDRTRQAQPIAFQDAKKRTFAAVNYCKYCYNVVYQENPLYLQEMAGEQKPLKIGGLRYSFTTESREQTEQILAGRLTERTQAGHFERGIE